LQLLSQLSVVGAPGGGRPTSGNDGRAENLEQGSRRFHAHDSEAEVLLKGVEIPVAVEQSVALAEAEGRYQAVNGLADGDPLGAEGTVVQRGGQG